MMLRVVLALLILRPKLKSKNRTRQVNESLLLVAKGKPVEVSPSEGSEKTQSSRVKNAKKKIRMDLLFWKKKATLIAHQKSPSSGTKTITSFRLSHLSREATTSSKTNLKQINKTKIIKVRHLLPRLKPKVALNRIPKRVIQSQI